MLASAGWHLYSKRFLLELIVMLYLRGHPLTDIKKSINFAKCKGSVYYSFNIISPSLLKSPQLPISVSSVTQKVCKYPDFFMQPVHVNFQVCAKVHEEDESPWLQGQECLWRAPDSSCAENRAASAPEHTTGPALPTEQLSRPGRNFTPWTCWFLLKSHLKQATVSIFVLSTRIVWRLLSLILQLILLWWFDSWCQYWKFSILRFVSS